MQDNWINSYPLLLVSEGSELNISPTEPGGASIFGVSVTALSDLRKSRGLPPATVDDIKNLTAADVEDFYKSVTAKACRFDDLPKGVDYRALDIFTNLGPTGGAWCLQIALGMWPLANTITDDVMSEVGKVAPEVLIVALGAAWLSKKHESSGWPQSGHGWTNRANRVTQDAAAMLK